MNVLTCTAARRQMDAFHDDELSVSDQIAVSSHLEWCDPCAEAYGHMRLVRDGLRALAPGRQVLTVEEATTIRTSVVNRVRAEHTGSFAVRVRDMFDDMHFVYAGLGATVAMLFFVMTFAAVFHLATQGPGSNANPVSLDGRVLMPVALDGGFLTLIDPDGPAGPAGFPGSAGPVGASDSEFMIRAVVTREGTVENPELVNAMSDQKPIAPGTEEAKAAATLMGAMSRARFEPARVGGQTVAVNMVWLVSNTTVLGERPAMVRRTAAARKPVAWRIGPGVRVRAV
jgi:putative zinc finger protein